MSRKVRTKVGFAGKVEEIEVTVADNDPDPWGADAKLSVVGTRVPRVDGPIKVTGKAKYTYDVAPKGMLHGAILRSPHGAAVVNSIDTSSAEKLEGVVAVHAAKKAGARVLFHGDEIAGVAAETEEIAQEALTLIKVDYEVKPCVTTVEAASKKDAPRVFENRPNVQPGRARGGADADGAIEKAPLIVEATYTTEVQTHSSLETHGCVVQIDGGSVTAWASTQATFGCRQGFAGAAKVEQGNVRVISEHVGGGFGSKFDIGREGHIAVELTRKAGRPVKVMLDRKGEHLHGGNRPSSIQAFKGGVDKEGTIFGIKVATSGTGGIGGGAGSAHPGFYTVGVWEKSETNVITNAGEARAFRAPGHPQGFFGMESFLDELAEKAGIDPLEFRKKNCRSKVHLAEFDLAAEKFNWKERRRAKSGSDAGPKKRGAGMASSVWYNAGGQGFKVDIVVSPDGTVEVRNGAQDIGTGTRTVLAVLVAEELGLKPDQIVVKLGDTNFPPGPGSGGSTTAASLGPAARSAGLKAKKELLERAARDLKAKPEDLDLKDGVVVKSGSPTTMTFKKLCQALGTETLHVTGDREKNYAGYSETVAGVQMAEVEVDVETGQVRCLRVVAIQDAGRVVDRLTFESQVSGGVIQGVSYALFEERRLDPNLGVMVNPDFLNYRVAGSKDCPEIIAIAFDVANAKNNVGMMGLGEPPTIPTAGAIANAVANAIGVRVRSLPITPDKVLAALEAKKS
jgi:xanthine dehydrogenase YagR molybdenum-binding subunit